MLFHLTTRDAWQHAAGAGNYCPPSFHHEGFIHLSTEAQWPGVRERLFRDVDELLLLVIDPRRLHAEVRFEPADGDTYPHLYGALEIGAVIEVRELR